MGETIIKIFGIIPLADNTYVCNGFVFCYNKINRVKYEAEWVIAI